MFSFCDERKREQGCGEQDRDDDLRDVEGNREGDSGRTDEDFRDVRECG